MGTVNRCVPQRHSHTLLRVSTFSITVLIAMFISPHASYSQTKKPNILVIFGDDVGQTDVSAYSMGLMGFHTPNIDRIAKEGMLSPTIMRRTAARQDARRLLPVRVHGALGSPK